MGSPANTPTSRHGCSAARVGARDRLHDVGQERDGDGPSGMKSLADVVEHLREVQVGVFVLNLGERVG